MRYTLEPYEIPLANGNLRKGIFVSVFGEDGRVGIGEIAPLEGRSIETFEEALKIAHAFCQGKTLFAPPSVLFGVSSALELLENPLDENLPFEVTTLVEETLKEGSHIKIKLGSRSLKDAIAFTESVLERGVKPHIDLNSLWDIEKTTQFCRHFSPSDFRYIEDPTRVFTELESFYDRTGFTFAVDEYLLYHPLERILTLKGLTHLIIKPTLIGGFNECEKIVKKASSCTCVFSSAYETAIGLMHIMRMGKRLSPNEPLGIDTLSIFSGAR